MKNITKTNKTNQDLVSGTNDGSPSCPEEKSVCGCPKSEKEKNRVYSPSLQWECVDFLSEHLLGNHYIYITMLDGAQNVQSGQGSCF